jgi:homoserine kinase type II
MLTKQKIPKSVLNNILERFDLAVKKYYPLATSGNLSYIIETKNGSFFLRLCPSGQRWRSKNEILAEIELLDHLRKNHFPVEISLKDKNGRSIISWGRRHGYIRKFIKAREKLNPTLKEIKVFGCAVGRLHTLTEDFKTKHKRNHIFNYSSTKKHFNESKALISKSNFKGAKHFIESYKKAILSLHFSNTLPQGMLHEDLGKRHVLWSRGKIAQIVDFDRSYFGPLVFDLGQACRGWCFSSNWKGWSNEKFKVLIRGYEESRKLDVNEKRDLVDAIKFAILERALAFCLRYVYVTHDSKDIAFACDSLFKQIKMIENSRVYMGKILTTKYGKK